jgi:dinuclear metal center YbgI/SA1388 family protein
MEINKIVEVLENFAPPDTQENWDCSGWQIDLGKKDIKKIILCLSVTQNIVNQAVEQNCDMIIAHHPLFFVPFEFNKNIPIYSAHTNLDKADGGTTDTLIEVLEFNVKPAQKIGDFLRLIELEKEILLEDFLSLIKAKLGLETVRFVNNLNKKNIKRIAFCAGSGADFLGLAQEIRADVIVTGDVKYHNALESNVIIIDTGHFESEKPVLKKIKELLQPLGVDLLEANEKSPFSII